MNLERALRVVFAPLAVVNGHSAGRWPPRKQQANSRRRRLESESESDNATEGVIWKARDLWSAPVVGPATESKHARLIVYAVFGKDLRRASSSRRRLRFLRQAACRHQWLRRRLIIPWAAIGASELVSFPPELACCAHTHTPATPSKHTVTTLISAG